jgi:hypothetical protein
MVGVSCISLLHNLHIPLPRLNFTLRIKGVIRPNLRLFNKPKQGIIVWSFVVCHHKSACSLISEILVNYSSVFTSINLLNIFVSAEFCKLLRYFITLFRPSRKIGFLFSSEEAVDLLLQKFLNSPSCHR